MGNNDVVHTPAFAMDSASPKRFAKLKALTAGVVTLGMVIGGLALTAAPAFADTAPVAGTPETVTADALPTAQINGVAWAQAIAGNTVFVGGEFTSARPAGSPKGSNESARQNLMSYNLTTGVMTSWNPGANGAVRTVVVSADGSRVYVGGTFTTIAGAARNRVAAFDTATGALLAWNPGANAGVTDIASQGGTVWLTGNFTSVAGGARTRVAAVNASTAKLLPFTATVDGGYGVRAIVVNPTGDKVVIGGSFTSVNGSTNPGRGLAALDATTGASMPFAVNSVVRNAGENSAIFALASDGDSVYGTGYDYYGGPEDDFEGVFRADWSDGTLRWINDCHGDDYSVAASAGVVYSASHDHYCGNIGGFPQTSPKWTFHHSLAMSKDWAGGTLTQDIYGYKSYTGLPAAKLLQWYPDWQVGTYTGKSQAAWDVTANNDYVVYGGEFLGVNGAAQEGLVRFAKKANAPKKQGPQLSGTSFAVAALSLRPGQLRLSWEANTDRDNETLTYELFRQGTTAPIYTTTAKSNFWTQPIMKFTDKTVTAGQTYQYRVRATDPDGNVATGAWTSVQASSTPASAYSLGVIDDGALHYWPLSETSGTVGADWAEGGDVKVVGATRNVAGPDLTTSSKATQFAGADTSYATSSTLETGPDTYTVEAWFNTTSTTGGKIVGFGNSATAGSNSYDRHVYLTGDGQVVFGNYPNDVRIVTSVNGLNDGKWHYVAASLGADGMKLYVDGKLVGGRTDTTNGQAYTGYWHIGGDSIGGWPGVNSQYLNGAISDVAVYDKVLPRETVDRHWVNSGRTSTIPPAPADAYGKAVYDLSPTLFWRANDAGATAADSGKDVNEGTYYGDVQRGAAGVVKDVANSAITLRPNGETQTGISSNAAFTNPTTFALETWFKTDSTSGGKIFGFGSSQQGRSGGYDRHIYMSGDGRVKFGTWTGRENLVVSQPGYNDNAWHQVVAQISSAGMQLYIDGALVDTNPNTGAQDYTGYWRVGGDNGWEGDLYWRGSVDEVAVYPTTLTAQQISAHYDLARLGFVNNKPTAAFSSIADQLKVAFDASTSSDAEGPIASYAWNFGDGATATGSAPNHTYGRTGTFDVTLTVVDQQGASTTITQPVSVVGPNILPSASFTAAVTHQSAAFDARASVDSDGTIASYAWAYGDGSTGTGATTTHEYAAAGTYTVTLTVTDDRSGSVSTDRTIVTTAAPGTPADAYGAAVFNLSPTLYWRLGESGGSVAADSGVQDNGGRYYGNVTHGQTGALTGVSNTAVRTNPNGGDQTGVASDRRFSNPTTFALETWFKTDSTSGGKIIGFGDNQQGWSSNYDRHVYMSGDGRVKFGVWTGQANIVESGPGYNDNRWHHVVAQISSGGMQLFIDGQLASTNGNSGVQPYDGYWRVGGDSGWEGDGYWRGTIDEVAVYPAVLTAKQVRDHFQLGASGLVNEAPVARFASTGKNLTFAFDGTTSSDVDGPIASYAWNFGDGTTGQGPTPTHTFAAAATYAVTLTVTDGQGMTHSVVQNVVAPAPNALPTADFTATTTDLSVMVDGTASADTDGSIVSYAWSFGDGATSSEATVSHAYTAAGAYDVTLTVTDDRGGSAQRTKRIEVVAPNQAPTAAFTPTVQDKTISVDASASVDSDGTIASYVWAFGDGTTTTRTTPTTTHEYAAYGTYQVSLTVIDDDGAESQSLVRQVVVERPNRAPSASFTTSANGLGLSVDGAASTDPDGDALGYAWAFGDGANGVGVQTTHSYAAAGTYTVTLTVTDGRGGSNVATKQVTVVAPNQAPTARFTSSSSGLTLSVDGRASTDPENAALTYAWNFGDGSSASGAQATHAYTAAGTYTVTLTVVDDRNATNTTSAQVTVTAPAANQAPTAAFTATADGLTVAVNGSASADPEGATLSYAWNFGDGTTGTGAQASRTYATAGTYTVTLTVTDDKGATGTKTSQVTVTAPATSSVIASDLFERTGTGGWGTADKGGAWTVSTASRFSVANGAGRMTVPSGQSVSAALRSVSSSSTRVTAQFTLDKIAEATYVTIVGRQVGSAQYSLRIRPAANGAVQMNILRDAVSVGSSVVPNVTLVAGEKYTVVFDVTGTSPTTLSAKLWKSSSTEPSAWQATRTDTTAALQAAGSVQVLGWLPSSASAANPLTIAWDSIVVTDPKAATPANQAPTAAFTSSANGLTVALDGASSTDPENGALTYAWNFGDGGTATGAQASHPYATAGTYTVTLTVTDDKGATATKSAAVTVTAPAANQAPVARFTSSASGLTASFDGAGSSDADGTIASFAWNFGDGVTATGAQTSHPYGAAGTYTVTLTVTDDKGATGSTSATVTVAAATSNVLARDGFDRTATNGWGTAETGGAWSVTPSVASRFSVANGVGQISVATGTSPVASLGSVSSTSARVTAEFTLDKIAEGQYITLVGRQVGSSAYSLRIRTEASGASKLYILRDSVALGGAIVPPVTLVAGQKYTVVFEVTGTGTTTLSTKLWATSAGEPAGWLATRSDTTAALQAAGSVNVSSWLPSSASASSPVLVSFDSITVIDPTIP